MNLSRTQKAIIRAVGASSELLAEAVQETVVRVI